MIRYFVLLALLLLLSCKNDAENPNRELKNPEVKKELPQSKEDFVYLKNKEKEYFKD